MNDVVQLKKKDFESDQDVRWCPGCGDYAVLATVQRTLAQLGVKREKQVFISGIGCSSRFPYYMQTYGFHSIHGRAPSIATGLKVARPDLDVWVITGDGDALSIGGNHLLHVLRRNVNVNIILFNNQIYGLTKGQYSPTSQQGKKTPSTPFGSIDYPVNPLTFAAGAGATFIARAPDTDAKKLGEVLKRAHAHQGVSFIEVLQNCPVFNDGVWEPVTDKKTRASSQAVLEHGKPISFGENGEKGIRLNGLTPEITTSDDPNALIHDEGAPMSYSFLLASLQYPDFPVPVGIFRAEQKTTYDAAARQQVNQAKTASQRDLASLLQAGMTWTVK